MVFRKRQRKIDGRYGRKEMKCFECGAVIELGDVFYNKITKRHGEIFIRHYCEDCYEKQFVTV